MLAKKQLGQFFTTNSDWILQGLEPFIAGKNIVDPFAGAGDLLHWARRHGARSAVGYDIDESLTDGKNIIHRDSFALPPQAEFIITNPPYLYQNKLQDNRLLAQSRHTDLYQLALEKMMESIEGIVLVPINFLSAENAKYIRQIFLEKFAIIKANYFTEPVFADTSYNIIAFYYRKKLQQAETMAIDFTLYRGAAKNARGLARGTPQAERRSAGATKNARGLDRLACGGAPQAEMHGARATKSIPAAAQAADAVLANSAANAAKIETKLTVFRRHNWQIGGEFLAAIRHYGNRLQIGRLEEEDLHPGNYAVRIAYNHLNCRKNIHVCETDYNIIKNNIMLLKAIDTGTEDGQIRLEDIRNYDCDALVSIKTSRNQIQLVLPPYVSIREQEQLINLFNRELNAKRQEYYSLFMTNYRDKNRKRISFNFAYKLLNYLYFSYLKAGGENRLNRQNPAKHTIPASHAAESQRNSLPTGIKLPSSLSAN
ncbi:MAG: class I SAM-dependent methyltransferase [Candidatus Tokpelaia sp.]|nr:MAG: class I SAM-dependent methyltransferase [Candidatus Tokpelaia sp.]KAA6205749.1 MAG: class I SAM-dependent methyltransferase [Candidatus Tokpelaia sp.]